MITLPGAAGRPRPRHQARGQRVGDEGMHGLVHEAPEVHTLAQASLVNAEAARQELVAAQGSLIALMCGGLR
jgi:hypothetical protein